MVKDLEDEFPMKTAEQLAQLPDDGNRYELVEGILKMMSPAGGRHGRIAARIGTLLGAHVHERKLGVVFAAETGFRIGENPDTVRAPDAAFVCQEKMATVEDETGFLPFAPDLAVEVISPSDAFASVEEKAFCWLDAGTQTVLIVEPESKSLHVYKSRSDIVVLQSGDEFDASDVVAGWKLKVTEVFQ